MKKFLSTMTALVAVGACDEMNVASGTFKNIDRAINANVCDNWDEVDGEFDVVGEDGEVIGTTRGRSVRPTANHSRSMQRGAGNFSRGGMSRAQSGRGVAPHGYGGNPGMMLPHGAPNPPWFQSAFGVSPNTEQMHILPLTPQANNGIFSATVATISYQARPQRPFRGERPLVTMQATGTTSVGVQPFSTLITVGVIPQQVEIGNIPISLWAPTAFGVRLAMTDAAPGVLINFPVQLPTPNPITTTDTLFVQISLIGRVLA